MREYPNAVRARPSNDFHSFRHLADQSLGGKGALGTRRRDVWVPPTDVYETRDSIVIKMSVPGIKTGNVQVSFGQDVVAVSGYRGPAPEPGLVAYHQMEILNGYFERRVVIHKPVNPQATTAEYKDGFLWIRIPRAAERVLRAFTIRIKP